ncbi:phosphoglucomutase, partial [Staphylococcus kloosii]
SLNVAVNNVLTGFKYISDLLSQKETSSEKLLLAFEESHGYLAQSISRDKDAIQMVPLIIKYKNLLAQNGLSFKEILDDIYNNIGHFKDKTIAPMFEGQEGNAKIERIMQQFRQEDSELATICGLNIRQIEDYEKGSLIDKESETDSQLDLPKTNLIRFIFDEGFIALRPSGTEPKIKLYFSLNVENIDDISQQFVKTFIE